MFFAVHNFGRNDNIRNVAVLQTLTKTMDGIIKYKFNRIHYNGNTMWLPTEPTDVSQHKSE